MALHIAITGATGFVGKSLLPLLLEAGHKVSALVRNPAGAGLPPDVRIIAGELADERACLQLTEEADVVVHVAGMVTGIDRNDFMRANLDGTVVLAKAASTNNIKRFVYVSSLAAREPRLNAYAASKSAAELAMLEILNPTALAIVRPAAVYGPGDEATLPLLKALTSRVAFIPGSAKARFGMIHVDDVARVLAAAAVSDVTGTYEVDDGSGGHGWSELISLSRQHFGTPQRVVYIPKAMALALGMAGDGLAQLRRRPSLVNSGQIRQIYHADWRVKGTRRPLVNPVQLQDGLPQTIRWYQAQGLLPQSMAADRRTNDSGTTG